MGHHSKEVMFLFLCLLSCVISKQISHQMVQRGETPAIHTYVNLGYHEMYHSASYKSQNYYPKVSYPPVYPKAPIIHDDSYLLPKPHKISPSITYSQVNAKPTKYYQPHITKPALKPFVHDTSYLPPQPYKISPPVFHSKVATKQILYHQPHITKPELKPLVHDTSDLPPQPYEISPPVFHSQVATKPILYHQHHITKPELKQLVHYTSDLPPQPYKISPPVYHSQVATKPIIYHQPNIAKPALKPFVHDTSNLPSQRYKITPSVVHTKVDTKPVPYHKPQITKPALKPFVYFNSNYHKPSYRKSVNQYNHNHIKTNQKHANRVQKEHQYSEPPKYTQLVARPKLQVKYTPKTVKVPGRKLEKPNSEYNNRVKYSDLVLHPAEYQVPAPLYRDEPYSYSYEVTDDYTGTKLSAAEEKDKYSNTHGSYQVNLSDGRAQYVQYRSDDYGGYRADVEYKDGGQYFKRTG